MNRSTDKAETIRKKVAAHRAKQAAAGRSEVNTYLSTEMIQKLDALKKERGVASRAPLIEEAVRFYFENMRA
ncbi:ribbon-helix-helix protein, CopG family [Rhizobium sp. CFBP 8762]|uniref:ribbon-helix-helix protein, CopG family n=1 Tax=Rhizobium sp. CFBP 8762 TaxID=2775279 RepID=UPI0017864401|nr:ribbon-helix-helix protein, CopG family [Rhizobium sp. CFBP 8762]MBD8556869.1 ribbon-helix-helix protein, CopG family [Rhizobium sp. CFBP 8762]